MKSISQKEPLAESDLEEGEIPEFECQNTDSAFPNSNKDGRTQPLKKIYPGGGPKFGQLKDNWPGHIQNLTQSGLVKKSVYFSCEKGRYEGEYVSEEPNSNIRNQVPQNTYDYNSVERRLKHPHPFQTTYGSVEHIMTKIGETLGRNSDSYYKGRRLIDPRNSMKFNNNLDAAFRESGSLYRRFKKNYHKRRHSESNSDSDKDIWETRTNFKNRNPAGSKRKEEKDFKKKRKFKKGDSIVSDTEPKKYKLPEICADTCEDSGKSNIVSNERLLKGIRELQERENGATKVPFADNEDDCKTIPYIAPFSLPKKPDENVIASSVTITSDDNQEIRNDENISEKSSVTEDSDDDVELIKLRLLALTSNKRKHQALTDEEIKDHYVKPDENYKVELSDDEKQPESSQFSEEAKNNQDSDIDRYELMLRAEALKTALLKKHSNRSKKRKNISSLLSVGHGDEDIIVPEKQENKDIEEKGVEGKAEKSSFSMDKCDFLSVPESYETSENQVNFDGRSENSVSRSPNPEKCDEPHVTDSKQCVTLPNLTGKKIRKRRLKKNRKLNLAQVNRKENNRTPEEDDEKSKFNFLESACQKKTVKEQDKKFVLIDSLQLSNFQSAGDAKLSLNFEQSEKTTVPTKPKCATSKPKIPQTEIERIIVHLGSESSDDEALVQNNPKRDDASREEPENTEPSFATGDAHNKIADYEKSVELLLKDARRRIEQNMETTQKIPTTPEAVYNHLAPSQRLEYMRLKKKIAETEILRKLKEKTIENPIGNQCKTAKLQVSQTSKAPKNALSNNKPSSGNKNVLVKNNSAIVPGSAENARKVKNGARISPKNVANNVPGANPATANSVTSVKNILERKKTLTQNRLYLERLKVLWKNIRVEKMVEDKCKNELRRLKIQQNFFESKISQQRTKIKKMAEESKNIYEAFQKLNKGLQLTGKKKKQLAAEETKLEGSNVGQQCQEVNDAAMEEEGNLIEKKIDGIANVEDKEHCGTTEISHSGNIYDQLKEYNSPLQRQSTGSESPTCRRVDPNTIMCQYDLTGRCNDEECPYQHLRA